MKPTENNVATESQKQNGLSKSQKKKRQKLKRRLQLEANSNIKKNPAPEDFVSVKKMKKKSNEIEKSNNLSNGANNNASSKKVSHKLNETKGKVEAVLIRETISSKRKGSNAARGEGTKKIKVKDISSLDLMKLSEPFKHSKPKLTDSYTVGKETFQWILGSVSLEDFLRNYWEKKELLIKSENRNKFNGILSCADIDKILRKNNLEFTKNIDVTSYKNGKRETLNPEGRALAGPVWDFYNSGCSIRMLNPQTFHRPVWKLLSTLQEYFHSFCGANVYLTPPGTQGFAPHWDDIEAFILQLEGKKRWRVYRPRSSHETLPRESSRNFGPEDKLGSAVLDHILEPGELLYFPRGFIHQGEALNDSHSLHITFSTYQKNAWVDLLEKLLPAALATASEEDVEFRKGLPLNYVNHLGAANQDRKSDMRETVVKKVKELVDKMMNYAPIDAAVDQMAKGHIYDSLPPLPSADELICSVFDGGEKWSPVLNTPVNRVEITPESSIRLLRRGCVRMVLEENSVRLYHNIENSREYHAEEPKFIEIESTIAPGVEALIQKYPKYTKVENLPLETLEDKINLAIGLWEKGIVTTSEPLEPLDDDSSTDEEMY